jgi:hypothetical protein
LVLAVKSLNQTAPNTPAHGSSVRGALRPAGDRRLWSSTKRACRSGVGRAAEEEKSRHLALERHFEIKICGGQRDVLPVAPSHEIDLPSMHRQERWKSYNPQTQEKAVAMG